MESEPKLATQVPPAAPAQPVPATSPRPNAAPVQRDRIVVIGRRQSGKTVYLATLYEQLWRSRDHLTGKALTGQGHKHLMDAATALHKGEWPSATLGTARVEMEIEYNSRKHLLVALDFAGEVFAKAFLNDAQQGPETAELLAHIDKAAAVILLVDPSVGFGNDHEAAMEEDFGFVQAVERIRNWPGGESVPLVVVLTKIDQHKKMVQGVGGPAALVRHHFPALVRLLRQIPIFPVSAVQTIQTEVGVQQPSASSKPVDIDKPLKHCLRAIHEAEDRRAREFAQSQERNRHEVEGTRQREKDKTLNLVIAGIVSFILVAGIAVASYILYKK